MMTRKAYRAGSFYPFDKDSCRQQIQDCLGEYVPPSEPASVVAGIVPHAGWIFSGPTAAKVFKSIQAKASPETFLIFGAVHVWGMSDAAMFPEGAWETPCGSVSIDDTLAARLLEDAAELVHANPSAHAREHSIEVQIPFIQQLFPEAKILPIMVSPGPQALRLGERIGNMLADNGGNVIVLGSTDLTHYGPSFGFTPYGLGEEALRQMKENDRRIIDLALDMQADSVVQEAAQHRNACGAGAIAATVAAAKVLGVKRGHLLEHVTSQEVMPERQASDAVGYAGIIF
jgi:MEMO1 family protein